MEDVAAWLWLCAVEIHDMHPLPRAGCSAMVTCVRPRGYWLTEGQIITIIIIIIRPRGYWLLKGQIITIIIIIIRPRGYWLLEGQT